MINEEILNQSLFIKDWVENNITYFKLQYPQAKESDLRRVLMGIAKRYVTNQNVHLHNDYMDDMVVNSDLLKIYDWYQTTRPIAAGNGTFFYAQDKKYCPIQNVIDGRIHARKDYQHKRDEYIGPGGDTSAYFYRYYDINL